MLTIGQKVRVHGGYSSVAPACPECGFQCTYVMIGVVTGPYEVWNQKLNRYVPMPEYWSITLESGSQSVAHNNQIFFDINVAL